MKKLTSSLDVSCSAAYGIFAPGKAHKTIVDALNVFVFPGDVDTSANTVTVNLLTPPKPRFTTPQLGKLPQRGQLRSHLLASLVLNYVSVFLLIHHH